MKAVRRKHLAVAASKFVELRKRPLEFDDVFRVSECFLTFFVGKSMEPSKHVGQRSFYSLPIDIVIPGDEKDRNMQAYYFPERLDQMSVGQSVFLFLAGEGNIAAEYDRIDLADLVEARHRAFHVLLQLMQDCFSVLAIFSFTLMPIGNMQPPEARHNATCSSAPARALLHGSQWISAPIREYFRTPSMTDDGRPKKRTGSLSCFHQTTFYF